MDNKLDKWLNMLSNPLTYESYEIESSILDLEDIKDSYRTNNQTEFEKYDILQEKFYKILEIYFDIKYEYKPDTWNQPKK